MTLTDAALQRRMDAAVDKARGPRTSGPELRVHLADGREARAAAPDAYATHAVASVTKLVAAVWVLRHVHEGVVSLEQPIASILPAGDLTGLNRHGGTDHAATITLRDALAHTSGIPDYYARKRLDPRSDIAATTAADPGWTYDEALDIARGLDAKFAPHSGRMQYSFTNYQLVGRVIETLAGVPLATALQRDLFDPLGLTDTALITPDDLGPFEHATPILFGTQSYLGARRLASLGAEGALVSSTADMVRFLTAVIDGDILDERMLALALTDRLPLVPRAEYGVGIISLRLPRLITGCPHAEPLVGHAGMTGFSLFADRRCGITIASTTNQLAPGAASTKLMLRGLRAAHKQLRG